ncbi:hypothetical protein [Tamlana sp. I1]|uniref:hypothetical protein n=1 Tax=Tamlana sp. I1 TaxID=2762061 RepID=UPI0018902E18|nr:hypothetical protein [Tamlana sp. I1]
MKNPTFLKLALAFVLSFYAAGYAQETAAKSLLKSYIEAANNLHHTQDPESVLSLFGTNYQNNTAFVGLTGVLNRTSTNYTQLQEKLENDLKNQNYNFTMSLKETVYESQKERGGTVSALINFESKIDGKLAEKGTILMNIIATKTDGDWKITQNNTVRVSEQSDIGNCVCNLFTKGESFFTAETYYPSGVKYEREYKSYRIGNKDGKLVIVNRGNSSKSYTWEENGDVLDGALKIGSAKTPDQAIQTVLSRVYGETCTKINFN